MYRPSVSPKGSLALVAGSDRVPAKLVNGVRNSGVFLVARATVTVTVAAATTLRNRGSVWALIDEIVLDENGTDKSIVRGNVLRYLSETSAPSALSAVRAQTPVGVYNLEEACFLRFADPLALDPLETAFVEHDARQALNVLFRPAANFANKMYTVGPATVVVSGLTVTVEQDYETPTAAGLKAPLFIPTIRQSVEQITGDVTQLPLYIRTTNAIRKMVISQEDSVLGEVGDILRAIALKGDFKDIIGPTPMTIADMLLRSEFEFGGAVVSSNRAHIAFNFQRYGQLSESLNPAQDANLRLQVSALPSVLGVAAGGTSSLRITTVELYRDPAVVAPSVPFAY